MVFSVDCAVEMSAEMWRHQYQHDPGLNDILKTENARQRDEIAGLKLQRDTLARENEILKLNDDDDVSNSNRNLYTKNPTMCRYILSENRW
jgi:hypothetical protein